MAGMFAGTKDAAQQNWKGSIKPYFNPLKLITDKDTREAALDPLNLTKAPKPAEIETPTVEPVKAMPTPDDAQAKVARRRAQAAKRRGGRQGTILSAFDEPLGG